MRATAIADEAFEHLQVARLGVRMIDDGKGNSLVGLRNVAIFGRMVTFALNNLRSVYEDFEDFDIKCKKICFDNEVSRYFYKLRNQITKQAKTPALQDFEVQSFDSRLKEHYFGPRPKNATGFVSGDITGGAYWSVDDGFGNTEKFYVTLPPGMLRGTTVLPEFKNGAKAKEEAEKYVAHLYDYLTMIRKFIAAKDQFK